MPPRSGRPDDARHAVDPDVTDGMLAIALAALWADGRERPAEVGALQREIDRLEVFEGLGADHLMSLAADLRSTYAQDGVEGYLEAHTAPLDGPQRLQALTLAIDVVLADREVTAEELTFIGELRARLDLAEAEADRIVEVLESKHGVALAISQPPRSDDKERFIVPSEASVAFAVGAARAAGLEDQGPDRGNLAPLRARGRVSEKTFDALVRRVEHRFGEGEPGAYLAACAQRLDEEGREHAFAWAADIVLADRRLTEPEHSYLTEIRDLLGVEPSRASRIVDVLWAKHLR